MSTLSTFRPSRGRAREHHPGRPGVPWGTVATLAVGLSCASAFWLVSLAGAVGAPERYETPSATWAMLSLTLLPVFGLGVLGVLTIAKHWFGPVLRGGTQVVTTALLILATGTLIGVAAIVASSAYDYGLQLPHIGSNMAGMAHCTGACIPKEQHAIFDLHVRGVVLVSQKLLLTNALFVAWVVAMWGGRIKLTNRSWRDAATVEQHDEPTGSLGSDARMLLAGLLAGAAVINLAAGGGIIVLAVGQLVVAGLVLARFRERALLLAAGALSLASLGVWLWSRPLGLADVLACVLEVGAVLLVWTLLRPGRLTGPAPSAHTRALVVLALVATVAIGFAATGPSWFDAFGVSAAHHSSTEVSP